MRWDVIVGVVLGSAFLASIVNQLGARWWDRLIVRVDQFTVLPFWAFFAPNPGYASSHLVFRDLTDGAWSSWRQVSIPSAGPLRWIWNPTRYERKAVQDLVNGLAEAAQDVREPRLLELTECWLAIASWVLAQGSDRSATQRQFMVLQAIGHGADRQLVPLVVSRRYGLDGG